MNISKVLVAGGAGLLLVLTSMTSYSLRSDAFATDDPAQNMADSIGDTCAIFHNAGDEFTAAVHSTLNGSWDLLYTTTTLSNSGGHAEIDDMIGTLKTELDQAVQLVGCADVTCKIEVFDEGLTSTPKLSLPVTFAGGQEDGDVALVCKVNPPATSTSTSCTIGNMNNAVMISLPISARKDVAEHGLNTTTGLAYRDNAASPGWQTVIYVENSGTALGLSEPQVDQMLTYLAHGSRCGSSVIIPIKGGNTSSPFVNNPVYWIPY